MKKILPYLLVALLLATSALAGTAYRYTDSVTTIRGDAVGGASVYVYQANTTTKVTLYSGPHSGFTQQSNPVSTDGYGRFTFFVEPGTYDLYVYGSNITPYTLQDVRVFSDAGYTYNVLDYGAIPDDDVDDITAIRSAMTAANTAGGGTVEFPVGQFDVSSFISLYDNVSMKGQPGLSKIFMLAGSDTTMMWGNGIDNVTISGLWLDGNSDNNTADNADPWYLNNACAVVIRSGARNVRIVDNRIENFEYGVTASGEWTNHVEIASNHFNNVTAPIDTYGRGYVIAHNVIENCLDGDILGAGGIQIEVASEYRQIFETTAADTAQTNYEYMSLDNSIHGNTIRNVAGPAIVLHGGNIGVSVVDNHIANCEIGITAYNTNNKGVVISGNTIRNIHGGTSATPWANNGFAVGLNTSMGAVVSGNNIEYARTGIFTYKGRRSLISGNYIAFSTTSGICAYADSGSLVEGNYVYNAQWPDSLAYYNSGVLLHSCVETAVKDNHAVEFTQDGKRGSMYYGVFEYTGNSKIRSFGNTAIGTLKGVQNGGAIYVPPSAEPDTVGRRGVVWYDKVNDKLKVYTGSAWVDLH